MERKAARFNRATLYEEIWEQTLTAVAKKYRVPYPKLKEACEKANIPLPSNSYWSNRGIGKAVVKIPLPASNDEEVVVTYSVRPEESAILPSTPTAPAEADKQGAVTPLSLPRKNYTGANLYERDVLYKEVWEQPVTKVGEKYGVSDVMIHKVCKSLEIPVPPRGYWTKKQAGQPVEIIPLPESSGQKVIYGKKVSPESNTKIESGALECLAFLEEGDRCKVITTALNLRVIDDGHKLHSVLTAHKRNFSTWKKAHPIDKLAPRNRDTYRRIPEGEPPLWNSVSEEILPRVYLILNALYGAIEALGGSVNNDLSVQIRGETVWFDMTEGKAQAPHVLTKAEQKQWDKYEEEKKHSKWAYEPKFRKYDHISTGRLTFTAHRGSFFRDSATAGIEARIGEILLSLYAESEEVRIAREAKEAAKRKAEEEARQGELRRQRRNDEVDRLEALENEAIDYQRACRIRAYVAAVEADSELAESQRDWIVWAKAKADWFDPLIAREDFILGVRNHGDSEEKKKPQKSRW